MKKTGKLLYPTTIIILTTILTINLSSCKNSVVEKTQTVDSTITVTTLENDTVMCSCPEHLILNLQPLDGFSLKELHQLESDLKKHLMPIYPVTLQIWETDKKVQESCLYKPRNRYRADLLLRFLHVEGADFVTMGVINKDISTSIHGAKDYGIMGLSTCPGYTSVISSYRLKNKRNLWKLAIHEFLHTRGLPHCENSGCFMKDSHGKNAIETSSHLCKACKRILKELHAYN